MSESKKLRTGHFFPVDNDWINETSLVYRRPDGSLRIVVQREGLEYPITMEAAAAGFDRHCRKNPWYGPGGEIRKRDNPFR